jgi:hypothetical protein
VPIGGARKPRRPTTGHSTRRSARVDRRGDRQLRPPTGERAASASAPTRRLQVQQNAPMEAGLRTTSTAPRTRTRTGRTADNPRADAAPATHTAAARSRPRMSSRTQHRGSTSGSSTSTTT